MAGNTAYTRILFALDELPGNKKKKIRKSAECKKVLSGLDKRVTSDFATAYQ
jgi:hypothetical protein